MNVIGRLGLGIIVSLVVGLIMAGIGILMEAESNYTIVFGTLISAGITAFHIGNKYLGAVIAILITIITYVVYIMALNFFGYSYAEGDMFNMATMFGAAAAGAMIGYYTGEDD